MTTRQHDRTAAPASISIAAAVNSGRRRGTDCAYSVPAVQASVAPCRARMDAQWPGSMPAFGTRDERHAEQADQRSRPDPHRPALAGGAEAVEQRQPHRRAGRRSARRCCWGCASPTTSRARCRRRAAGRRPARSPPTCRRDGRPCLRSAIGGDAGHDRARDQEAEGGRGHGRHLAHHDADGHVGRAPDHVDDRRATPRAGSSRRSAVMIVDLSARGAVRRLPPPAPAPAGRAAPSPSPPPARRRCATTAWRASPAARRGSRSRPRCGGTPPRPRSSPRRSRGRPTAPSGWPVRRCSTSCSFWRATVPSRLIRSWARTPRPRAAGSTSAR